MSDDLIKRLRRELQPFYNKAGDPLPYAPNALCNEAADEIERLLAYTDTGRQSLGGGYSNSRALLNNAPARYCSQCGHQLQSDPYFQALQNSWGGDK